MKPKTITNRYGQPVRYLADDYISRNVSHDKDISNISPLVDNELIISPQKEPKKVYNTPKKEKKFIISKL